MAVRPVFLPMETGHDFVRVELVEFEWIPGMAKTQRQKCVDSLHTVITTGVDRNILEISSKSRDQLGIQMSAFHLGFKPNKGETKVSVESAFQGSKVFEGGGPFREVYSMSARDAKKFFKDKSLGKLLEFNFYGQSWPLNPFTLFYDWIYMNSLRRDETLAQNVLKFDYFTDIEFNPKKSINCQAYSAALFTSLCRRGEMEGVLENRDTYTYALNQQPDWISATSYNRCHLDAGRLLF